MSDEARSLPMTEQVPPSPSAVDQVIKDLLGFHDCADGDVQAGNGHFRLVCISDSDQQRLNLRALLREAAHDLASLKARIQDLTAELRKLQDIIDTQADRILDQKELLEGNEIAHEQLASTLSKTLREQAERIQVLESALRDLDKYLYALGWPDECRPRIKIAAALNPEKAND